MRILIHRPVHIAMGARAIVRVEVTDIDLLHYRAWEYRHNSQDYLRALYFFFSYYHDSMARMLEE